MRRTSRIELLQFLAEPRMEEQMLRGGRQGLYDTCCSLPVDRREEFIKPCQIGERPARPIQFHQRGNGSGLSLARLSAQAWTA